MFPALALRHSLWRRANAQNISYETLYSGQVTSFNTPILKSLVVPVIWLALIGVIYLWITPFFASNGIFFLANEEAALKTKQPIRFQRFFKVTNQIVRKWKTGYQVANFPTFVSKTLIFYSQKWMNLILNGLSTGSIKYLNWPSPSIWVISKWM